MRQPLGILKRESVPDLAWHPSGVAGEQGYGCRVETANVRGA